MESPVFWCWGSMGLGGNEFLCRVRRFIWVPSAREGGCNTPHGGLLGVHAPHTVGRGLSSHPAVQTVIHGSSPLVPFLYLLNFYGSFHQPAPESEWLSRGPSRPPEQPPGAAAEGPLCQSHVAAGKGLGVKDSDDAIAKH